MLAIRRQLILAAASPWNKGIWERLTEKVSSLQEEKLLLCTSTFQASNISLKHPRRERAATCSWKEAASPREGGELERNHPGFWEPPQLQRDDKDGFNPSPAPGVSHCSAALNTLGFTSAGSRCRDPYKKRFCVFKIAISGFKAEKSCCWMI